MARPAGFSDVEFKNFSGLDLRGPPELLSDRSLSVCTNFEVGELGQLKSRPGFKRQHSGNQLGASPVKFLGQYITDSLSQLIVQTVTDNWVTNIHGTGKLYYSTDSGLNWTQMSASFLSAGRVSNYSGTANLNVPTSTGMYVWNGTTLTGPAAGTKNSSYNGFFAQDRYFTIENSSKQIWFSIPGNGSSYPAENTIGFTTDNKDRLVGMIPYRDRVVIFFTNSIRVLYLNGPPSAWIMRFLPFYMGVQNQECYYVYNDLIYFLSNQGFFRTDLTQLEELSKPIQPVFGKRWNAPDNPTAVYNKYSDCIGYWRDRFFISMRTSVTGGGGTGPTMRMFMYNIRNGAWSEIVPAYSGDEGYTWGSPNSFQPVFIGKKNPSNSQAIKEGLYFTSADLQGRIWMFDDENPIYYDGVSGAANNYTCMMRTKEIDLDMPTEYKRSHRVAVRYSKSDTSPITFKKYINEVFETTASLTTGVANSSMVARSKGPGYFRKLQMEVNDSTNQYLEVEGLTLNVKKKQELSESAS